MALIQCPECGGQVSSTAKQCVHCGCTYSVCHECGNVYSGEVPQCTVCGYKFAPAGFPFTASKNNSTQSGYSTDIAAAWKKRCSTDKMVMKAIRFADVGLGIIITILAAIVCLIIDMWDGNTLESLLKVNGIAKHAHSLIIAVCVIGGLVPIVSDIGAVYLQIMCGSWLRKNGIDAAPYVKKASSQVKMSDLPQEWDYENLSAAAYLSVVPHDASIKLSKYILTAILSGAIAVSVGICLTQNVDEVMRNKIMGDGFEFKYTALIAAAIFLAICFGVRYICEKIFNKRKELWLQSL